MKHLKPEQMAAIAGNLVCAESATALRDLLDSMGVMSRDCRQEGAQIDPSSRSNYLFNSSIAGIEQADVLLLVGANPRWEAPLVNARIRKAWLTGKLRIFSIGQELDLTYGYETLGQDPRTLADIASGRHPLAHVLAAAKNPMLILGTAALARSDGQATLQTAKLVAEKCGMIREGWNGFNVLHHAAGRVGALDAGFVPAKDGKDMAGIFDGCKKETLKLVYLLGADEFDMNLLGRTFVIYQGHHGDDGAQRADVILPGAAYTEKDATYVNLEGRAQRAKRCVFPPGQAKDDWAIIRALSDVLGKPLPYNSLDQLRARMTKLAPSFAAIGQLTETPWQPAAKNPGAINGAPFEPFITNFYMTNPIARASRTMGECLREASGVKRAA
jgi:NADH-quinone oxidoreductase subunit G